MAAGNQAKRSAAEKDHACGFGSGSEIERILKRRHRTEAGVQRRARALSRLVCDQGKFQVHEPDEDDVATEKPGTL